MGLQATARKAHKKVVDERQATNEKYRREQRQKMLEGLRISSGEAYEVEDLNERVRIPVYKNRGMGRGLYESHLDLDLFAVDDVVVGAFTDGTNLRFYVQRTCGECGGKAYLGERGEDYGISFGSYKGQFYDPEKKAEEFGRSVGSALGAKSRCFTCQARAKGARCYACGREY